jgi:aspartate-semialdehyde dehydrogenase
MLMGVGALYKAGLVEWMTSMTYQSASGGARRMRELLNQYGTLNGEVKSLLDDPKSAILEIDRRVLAKQQSLSAMETANFGVPWAARLIPGSTKTSATAPARKSGKAAQKPTRSWVRVRVLEHRHAVTEFACGSVPCVPQSGIDL